MSSQTQLDQEEVVQEVFPGAEFTAAREAKGLDVQDVANALNFSASHIKAIEEGRLEALPSRVFALGYLRAYARHVGLDENKAVEDYERLTGDSGKSKAKPLKTVSSVGAEPAKSKGGALKWLVIASLVTGVAAAGYWWTQQQKAPAEPAPVAQINLPKDDAAPETLVADATAAPAGPEAEIVGGAPAEAESQIETAELSLAPEAEMVPMGEESPAAEEAGASVTEVIASEAVNVASEAEPGSVQVVTEQVAAVENTEVPASVTTVESSSDEPVPVAAGEGHLKIVFNADCWVEVRDDTGRLLVASVRSPARGVDVRGKAPLKVTLGALSAVDSMTYNNDAVALEQRGRGNVLRVTLPVVE